MAQAVTTGPAIANQALPIASYQDIAGLAITILNGSGWVILSYTLQLLNTYAGDNPAFFQITIDGQAQPNSGRGTTLPESHQASISSRFVTKPGAGQHTFRLQGQTFFADIQIVLQNGALILEEPGF